MLSRPEILEAIKALGDGEKTSLAKIARLYAARTPYDGADLLQEAICRVLSRERNWPRAYRPSCCWAASSAASPGSGAERPAARINTGRRCPHGSTPGVDRLSRRIRGAFADDPTAQAVLVAVMKGNKGQELLAVIEPILNNGRDAAGATTKATAADLERELERVLKKIRRRVEKHRREVGPI
jgi:hypothetical protein